MIVIPEADFLQIRQDLASKIPLSGITLSGVAHAAGMTRCE
ncbi:hypothetical protein OOT33_10325 [Sphingobium sp. DEHP117]|nr:hypothetical protein [Sphingobium sp. DEHP117]MDQ4420824.1 hypothetical protein [Sphingobium sp. DEHP117]